MILERKKRRLSNDDPDKKSDDYNQSDASINKRSTVNSINKSTSKVEGPTDDDNENESQKIVYNGDADERWRYLSNYDK